MERAFIVARKLKRAFPSIGGIEVRKSEYGPLYIHLGDVTEGGTIEGDRAADYYGEFRGGYPWVHPKLKKIVESSGYSIEWNDPGTISAYES